MELQPSDCFGDHDFLPGLLANKEMAQRSNPALSKPGIGNGLSQDCLVNGEESAAHSILARSDLLQQRPYTFAQTTL